MAKTIEELLDVMYNTRESIRQVEKTKSDLQAIYDEAEYELVQVMQDAGVRSAGIDSCTATLKQEKYPQVVDMGRFVAWCADNNYSNMLQKRVSSAVFKEFFEQSGEYPDGIDTYDKMSVLVRKR